MIEFNVTTISTNVEMTTHLRPLVDRLMMKLALAPTAEVREQSNQPLTYRSAGKSWSEQLVNNLMLNSVCHREVWIWPQTEAPPPFSDPTSFSTLTTAFPIIQSETAGYTQRGRGLRWTQWDKSSRNYSCHVDQSQSLSVWHHRWHHINERRFSASILMAISHRRISWRNVSTLTNQNSNYEQDYADSTPCWQQQQQQSGITCKLIKLSALSLMIQIETQLSVD